MSIAAASARRLAWSAALAAGTVLGALVVVPSSADDDVSPDTVGSAVTERAGGSGSLVERYDTGVRAAAEAAALRQHETAPGPGGEGADGHGHDHGDLSTKNAVSRTADAGAGATDPTSLAERMTGIASVADQRAEPDPRLVRVPRTPARRRSPEDRYAMAGGCYALRSTSTGRWVARAGAGYAATSADRSAAEPFHFQATDLGRYLLFGHDQTFMAAMAGLPLLGKGTVAAADAPSTSADWVAARRGSTYSFALPDGDAVAVDPRGAVVLGRTAEGFDLRSTEGCADWDEIETNVRGRTFRGVSDIAETRGYVDAHTHGMAFEFLGGRAHCGRPWHPYGVQHALVDCPDHTLTAGYGAALETALSGRPGHDPVGWPTFKDWPAPDSLTHEGTYYKWMERSWRGRPAAVHQPARREQQALRALPAEEELLRRHGLDPPAGQADARFRALHRRAVGWSRRGLVPDRHQPLPGPQDHQPGQARGHHGHRDLGAVHAAP